MTESIHSVSSRQLKKLVALGKKCSKTAFPNPGREGCPGYTTLRAMANRDRRLTLDDFPISHVVRCSPCFQEYLRLRQMWFFIHGLQITAAWAVAIALSITAIRFIANHISRPGAPDISQRRPSQPPSSIPMARIPITIDLAAFSPTRGHERSDSKKVIHLPQRFLRVTFQLPFGMEPGAYDVRLKDSAGNVYADKRAAGRISGGSTALDVDLDLTAASPRSLTLMIRLPGLSWRTYPVILD